MSKNITAVSRLIMALEGKASGRSRTRIAKTICHLAPRRVFPTGILEISLGLGRSGKWWYVEIYFHVGSVLVCSQRTTNMNRGRMLHAFQILAVNEIFNRPAGQAVQSIFKKHDEYAILTELANDLLKEQDKPAGTQNPGPAGGDSSPEKGDGETESEHSESPGESESA